MLPYWWCEVEKQEKQKNFRVAVFEGTSSIDGDLLHNIKQVELQTKRASEDYQADLLVIPEVYLSGYGMNSQKTNDAANYIIKENVVEHFCSLARQYSIAILICYPELSEQKIYNSATLIDKKGNCLLTYRKTHLWAENERALYTEGDELSPVVEIDGIKVAVLICYDIEMSEVARCLALRGAQLLLVPTAIGPGSVNESLVINVVSARALENHVWIAYANHSPPKFLGLSRIVGPIGDTIASVEKDPLIFADLIPQQYFDSIRSTPYLADRRPSLYTDISDSKHLRKLPNSYQYTE